MSHKSIAEIHSPGKKRRESVGKVSNSRGDCPEPSDENSENNSWEEENSGRCLDIIEPFEKLGSDNSAKKSSRNGLREDDSLDRIASWNHGSIECRDDNTPEHGSSYDIEIIFNFLTLIPKWIRKLFFSDDFPIKKPGYKKCGHISSKIVEDFYVPIIEVRGRHSELWMLIKLLYLVSLLRGFRFRNHTIPDTYPVSLLRGG